MLCFIMALKARAISKDWAKVECLVGATLRSICQQTHSD